MKESLQSMGKKRIAIVALVVTIVVTLVGLLVFQASPDERLLRGYLPPLEQRFGVTLRYQSARASLSGVVIEGVEVRAADTGHLLCRAQQVGVGLRVGPLLVGEVQLTGVRFEGLEVLMGEAEGGASLEEWRSLRARLDRKKTTAAQSTAESLDFEVVLVSSSLRAAHGGVSLSVSEISGRLTRRGACALRTGPLEVSVASRRLVSADRTDWTRASVLRAIEAELTGARAEWPVEPEQLSRLQTTLKALAPQRDDKAETGQAEATGGNAQELPEIAVRANDARFEFVEGEVGVVPAVRDVTLRARLIPTGWSLSAAGRLDLPGNRRITVEASSGRAEPLSVTAEFDAVPLASFGPKLVKGEAVDWSTATVAGKLDVTVDSTEIKTSGQFVAAGLAITAESFAAQPVNGLDFHASIMARQRRGEPLWTVDRLSVERGPARLDIVGAMRTDRLAFDARFKVPRTGCRHLLAAVPAELKERLGEVVVDGQFEMALHLALDEQAPEQTVFEPVIDNRCRLVEPGKVPAPDYFRGPFAYTAVDVDGKDLRLVTGSGTDRWTPLHRICVFVAEALLTTEDGKFFHHQGVTAPEVRRAIELNLQRDKLSHGASTLTMQLAKNLFLGRERTVARKLQELFFVWYLESNFTKEELLELYLNVVEFGPNLYGITDAALTYFGREPAELTALESVFLIKLLPSPLSRYKAYEAGHLEARELAMLHRVLRTMKERRRLSEFEYQRALTESIVFHKEGEPLPEPRPESTRGLSDIVGSPMIEEEQEFVEEGAGL